MDDEKKEAGVGERWPRSTSVQLASEKNWTSGARYYSRNIIYSRRSYSFINRNWRRIDEQKKTQRKIKNSKEMFFFFSKRAQESSRIIIIRILTSEWINLCEIVSSYFFFDAKQYFHKWLYNWQFEIEIFTNSLIYMTSNIKYLHLS